MANASYPIFGKDVEFWLDTDDFLANELMEEAYRLGLKLQSIFNIFDRKSEISRLNSKRMLKASDELLLVLDKAIEICRLTGGLYDITHGRKFLARKKGEKLPKLSCSWKDIEISEKTVKLLHKDVWLDLGSIAKGYITDRIAEFFISEGVESGYINARGDIWLIGEQPVDIKDPRKEGILHTIQVKNKGVATSGDYKQFDQDYSKSHVINQGEVISATVVANSLMMADAYATVLMVCRKDLKTKLIMKIGFPAMTIDKLLEKTYYNGFDKLTNEN